MKAQSALAAVAVGLGSTVAAYSSGGSKSSGVQYGGVNLAGCDFQCSTEGQCTGGDNAQYFCPKPEQYQQQIAHFTKKWKHNIFRLPVGWQYITGNSISGKLGGKVWENYQGMVKECLASGSKCIIDIHNYGKFNGKNLGPDTDKDFANLWSQIAKMYASEKNIVFGIMNEPHDQDGKAWQTTCQGAVDAIREAGAKSQWILIPGPPWDHLVDFAETTSQYSLAIKDKADSSGKNLIMDLHQYYDSDGSGTNTECSPFSKVQSGFESAAKKLKSAGRQGFVSETGGGNTQSCVEAVGDAFKFLNANSDVFLGWAGWAAGAFKSDYALVETPTGDKDTLIVEKCVGGMFKNPGTKTSPETAPKPPTKSSPPVASGSPAGYGGSSPVGSSPGPSGSPSTGGGYNYPPKTKPKKKCKKKPTVSSSMVYMQSSSAAAAKYNYPPKSSGTPSPAPAAPSYNQPKKPNDQGQMGYDSGSSQSQKKKNTYKKRSGLSFHL